jgi:hypothetical protein
LVVDFGQQRHVGHADLLLFEGILPVRLAWRLLLFLLGLGVDELGMMKTVPFDFVRVFTRYCLPLACPLGWLDSLLTARGLFGRQTRITGNTFGLTDPPRVHDVIVDNGCKAMDPVQVDRLAIALEGVLIAHKIYLVHA